MESESHPRQETQEPLFTDDELSVDLVREWKSLFKRSGHLRTVERNGLPSWKIRKESAKRIDDTGNLLGSYKLRDGHLIDSDTEERADAYVVRDLTDALNSLQ